MPLPSPTPGPPAVTGLRASSPQGLARCLTFSPCTPFLHLPRTLTAKGSFPDFSRSQPCWRAREIALAVISRLLRVSRALRGSPTDPSGVPGSPSPLPPNEETPPNSLDETQLGHPNKNVTFSHFFLPLPVNPVSGPGVEREDFKKSNFYYEP